MYDKRERYFLRSCGRKARTHPSHLGDVPPAIKSEVT